MRDMAASQEPWPEIPPPLSAVQISSRSAMAVQTCGPPRSRFRGGPAPSSYSGARSEAGLLATTFNPVNAESVLPRGRGLIVKLERAPPSSTATRA